MDMIADTVSLVCPVCKNALAAAEVGARCAACERTYPHLDGIGFDMIPYDRLQAEQQGWTSRQTEMEEWYGDLLAEPEHAGDSLLRDYQPFASTLSRLSGSVLDIGGGAGLGGAYLPTDAHYTVVEPSLSWLEPQWRTLHRQFSARSPRHTVFVRGVGEYLPFPAQSFDAVMAFWSLNHAFRPDQVIAEIHRVLKPEGCCVAVLEDMEPRWSEIAAGAMERVAQRLPIPAAGKPRCLPGSILDIARRKLTERPWPVQSDHVRIGRKDVERWAAGGLRTIRCAWVGGYLTYTLRRAGTSTTPRPAH